jgi:hypothetical protein
LAQQTNKPNSDYFTKRQDRYVRIRNASGLATYYRNLITTLSAFSTRVVTTTTTTEKEKKNNNNSSRCNGCFEQIHQPPLALPLPGSTVSLAAEEHPNKVLAMQKHDLQGLLLELQATGENALTRRGRGATQSRVRRLSTTATTTTCIMRAPYLSRQSEERVTQKRLPFYSSNTHTHTHTKTTPKNEGFFRGDR